MKTKNLHIGQNLENLAFKYIYFQQEGLTNDRIAQFAKFLLVFIVLFVCLFFFGLFFTVKFSLKGAKKWENLFRCVSYSKIFCLMAFFIFPPEKKSLLNIFFIITD